MPYAPGIQDISGELLAQGMREKAKGIAGGAMGWLQGYEQNQQLKNQSLAAFSGLLGSDPDFQAYVNNVASGSVQVPDAVKKAVKNYQSGNIDVYDAAILGNTGQIFAKQKGDVVARAHAQAQTALATAQADKAKQEMQSAKQAAAYFNNLMSGGQEQDGTAAPQGTQVVGPSPAIVDFLGGQGAGSGQVGMGGPAAGQSVSVGAPAAAVTAARFAGGAGGTAAPAGAPTEQMSAAKLWEASGRTKIPTGAQIVAQNKLDLAEWRKSQIESKEYTSDAAAAKAVKDMAASGAFAPGTTGIVKKNPATGSFYIETATSSFEPTEQAAARAGAIKREEEKAKSDEEYVTQFKAKSELALEDIDRVREGKRILLQGKVKTGPTQGVINDLKKYLVDVGLASEESLKEVNDFDKLEALYTQGQLAAAKLYYKGQGAVNTFERQQIINARENARKKLGGANLELSQTLEAAYQKELDGEQYRQQLIDNGVKGADFAESLRRWSFDPKNSMSVYLKRIKQEDAQFAATPAAAPATESAQEMAARLLGAAKGK